MEAEHVVGQVGFGELLVVVDDGAGASGDAGPEAIGVPAPVGGTLKDVLRQRREERFDGAEAAGVLRVEEVGG